MNEGKRAGRYRAGGTRQCEKISTTISNAHHERRRRNVGNGTAVHGPGMFLPMCHVPGRTGRKPWARLSLRVGGPRRATPLCCFMLVFKLCLCINLFIAILTSRSGGGQALSKGQVKGGVKGAAGSGNEEAGGDPAWNASVALGHRGQEVDDATQGRDWRNGTQAQGEAPECHPMRPKGPEGDSAGECQARCWEQAALGTGRIANAGAAVNAGRDQPWTRGQTLLPRDEGKCSLM